MSEIRITHDSTTRKFGFKKDKEVITPDEYDQVFRFQEGFAFVLKDRKYFLINEQGETVLCFLYFDIWFSKSGIHIIHYRGSNYGYINAQGEEIPLLHFEESGFYFLEMNDRNK